MSVQRTLAVGGLIIAIVGSTMLTTAEAASAAPSTDAYIHASVIPATGHTWAQLDNVGATTEPGELTTFTETAYKKIWSTVWAKWTAPASGVVEVDTNASGDTLDTSLAIYSSASSMSGATRLAWDDDSGKIGHLGWSEIPSFAVTKGVTYYFEAGTASGTAGGETGEIYVNVNPSYAPPANDNAANAIPETSPEFSVVAGDFGATLERWESSPGVNSVWYRLTPKSTGSLVADTKGSAIDSYLSIWELTGSSNLPSGDLELVATDNDSGGDQSARILLPTLNAGSTYYFAVGTASGSDGNVKLNVAETLLGPAITKITPTSGSVKGGTKVTIEGARLTDVNEVDFGAASANGVNIVHSGSTKLTVTTPAVAVKGKVYVQLDTSTGLQSVISTLSHFTFD